MVVRGLLILFVAVNLLFTLTSLAYSDDTIFVKNEQIVTKSFLGFGVEWDTYNYAASGITDKDFQLITERIQKMKLPIVRIMMLGKYCYIGNGKFNWNSDSMKFIYKQLDFCQKQGIKVILCSWGAGTNSTDWMKMPDISGVDDPKYTDIVGSFMDYLINTKGYSCIKYFSAGNEPDLELKNNWNLWKKSITDIAVNFKNRGLNQKLALLGPEISPSKAENWLKKSNSELPDLLNAFSMHYYASRELVKAGNLEQFFVKNRNYISSTSSLTANKPFLITEAGMNDDAKHPYGNPHIFEYDYGIFITDYAVQAARSGAASVLAWMLDDNSHKGFYWGLWSNKVDGMKIRPWYTTWALLSKYFPPGSIVYRVEQPTAMRILVARKQGILASNSVDFSFCLVNRDTVSRNIRINISNAKSKIKIFNHYVYTQTENANSTTNPYLIAAKESINLKGEIVVVCPPNSVTVLSSMFDA